MESSLNELGQPVGELVKDWVVPAHPHRSTIAGRYCALEPLSGKAHSKSLYAAYGQDKTGANWTYLPYGPFQDPEHFHAWVTEQSEKLDPLFLAVVEGTTGAAVGVTSFLRITPSMGSIEIGHIHFSPQLQGTPAATEALHLMLKLIFSLGYRRCEWKCDALNKASRNAALRLGFIFEGVFRQAGVVKGRNRDTAWFSILDQEWPALDRAFQAWLEPENFSSSGSQKQRLSELTARVGTAGRVPPLSVPNSVSGP